MSEKLIKLSSFFLLIVGGLLFGYILLVLVYLIPTEAIYENVKESTSIIQKEGLYPSLYASGTYVDNWTDADCISVTYNIDSKSPFYNALNAFQLYSTEEVNQWGTHNLIATMENRTDASSDHSYLWNGFRIWLRPLLVRYNISEIRQWLAILVMILIAVVAVNICRNKNNIAYCLPFLCAMGLMNFQLEAVSLLFAVDVCVALMACIALFKFHELKQYSRMYMVFGFTGTLVGFSSMLIIPSITLGFPLVIALSISERGSNKEMLREFIKNVFAWVCGYGITMISKIIIAGLMIKTKQEESRVIRYLGVDDYNSITERFVKLVDKIRELLQTSQIQVDIWCVFLIILAVLVVLNRRYIIKNIIHFVLLVACFCIPFIWILLVTGHTHHGFTLFNFAISYFALFEILIELIMSMTQRELKNYGSKGVEIK